MSALEFILCLTILLLILLMRKKIAIYINDSLNLSFEIKSNWIAYSVTLVFVTIIIVAMIFGPKQSYGVSGGIENIGTSSNNKPHRFFDINFDIFEF